MKDYSKYTMKEQYEGAGQGNSASLQGSTVSNIFFGGGPNN